MEFENRHSDNGIIVEIQAGKEDALRRIYPLYLPDFKKWAKKYFKCTDDDLNDAYQEALVALYRNVLTGKLVELKASLKTYLFAIAYRQLYRQIHKNRHIQQLSELPDAQFAHDTHFLQELIQQEAYHEQQTFLRQAINQLPETCQKILELFFYQNLSITQIKEAYSYASENSVSVQKSRCLKSLRDIIEKKA